LDLTKWAIETGESNIISSLGNPQLIKAYGTHTVLEGLGTKYGAGHI
jgi:hypothetical protein